MVILNGRGLILNPCSRTTGRAYEIAWILTLLNTVVTLEWRTQRELSRLVVRDQRRGNELNTLTRSNHRCVVHLSVDTCFQQEIGEPPDIVQEYGKHEVEQTHTVVFRGGLREKVTFDRFVLTLDLPATTIPSTERLGLVGSDSEIRCEDGRPFTIRRRHVQESH